MKISFVSNNSPSCGVFGSGLQVYEALHDHSRHKVTPFFLGSEDDFNSRKEELRDGDVILFNFQEETFPYVTPETLNCLGRPVIGLHHEYDLLTCYTRLHDYFRYKTLLEPSLYSKDPNLWAMPRIVNQRQVTPPNNEVTTIGSYGILNAGSEKRFANVIKFAKQHFPGSRVIINAALGAYQCGTGEMVATMKNGLVARLHEMAGKEVEFTIKHDLLSTEGMIDFLASNDLNVFLYPMGYGRGISGALDFAMAAESPMCLSDSMMYRHIKYFAPELFLTRSSPQWILENGRNLCRKLKKMWTPENAANHFDVAFEQVLADWKKPKSSRLNTLIGISQTNQGENASNSPAVLNGGATSLDSRAAFILATIRRYADKRSRILSLTQGQDDIFAILKAEGHEMLHLDFNELVGLKNSNRAMEWKHEFDIIYSVSMFDRITGQTPPFANQLMESIMIGNWYVINALKYITDEYSKVIYQISNLLAVDGVAVLSLRYADSNNENPEWAFTPGRIYAELMPFMRHCRLVDAPDWSLNATDKEKQAMAATLVFQKLHETGLIKYTDDFIPFMLAEALFNGKINHLTGVNGQASPPVEAPGALAKVTTEDYMRSWLKHKKGLRRLIAKIYLGRKTHDRDKGKC